MATILARIRSKCVLTMYVFRRAYFVHIWGMDIGNAVRISLTAKLDKTHPKGVHIGHHTSIAFGAAIMSHDFVNNQHRDVIIGENCLIGARAIIMPGVTVGKNSIVSPASVVIRNVPANSLVVGNPARVVESNIITGPFGIRAAAFLAQQLDPEAA